MLDRSSCRDAQLPKRLEAQCRSEGIVLTAKRRLIPQVIYDVKQDLYSPTDQIRYLWRGACGIFGIELGATRRFSLNNISKINQITVIQRFLLSL
jgi:hypothetical protein